MIYTDEDKVTTDLSEHFQPHLKPDFNLDLLRSNNYICHFLVVRRSVVQTVGGFRREFDGAQDSLSDPDSGSSCPSLHRISAQSACPDPPGFRLPDTAPSSHMSVQGESPASVLKNAPVSDMQVPQC